MEVPSVQIPPQENLDCEGGDRRLSPSHVGTICTSPGVKPCSGHREAPVALGIVQYEKWRQHTCSPHHHHPLSEMLHLGKPLLEHIKQPDRHLSHVVTSHCNPDPSPIRSIGAHLPLSCRTYGCLTQGQLWFEEVSTWDDWWEWSHSTAKPLLRGSKAGAPAEVPRFQYEVARSTTATNPNV